MTATIFDPLAHLLLLEGSGASLLPRDTEAWRRVNRGDGRVFGVKQAVDPAELHPDQWEMHPHGDELLLLIDGVIDLITSDGRNEQRQLLQKGQAVLMRQGTWHRLLLLAPSTLAFLSPVRGTRRHPLGKPWPTMALPQGNDDAIA